MSTAVSPLVRVVLVMLLALALLPVTLPADGRANAQTSSCQSDPYAAAQATDADTVYYWNEVLLDAFRGLDAGPTVLARLGGMMHAGIYDVLNSVFWSQSAGEGCGWDEYLMLVQVDPATDADLAAGYAARDILLAELPTQHHAEVQQAFADRHGSDSQQAAFQLGSHVADEMIAARANDGSDNNAPYALDGVPGAWRPTGEPGCTTAADAVTPNWGNVTPFTMTSGSQFRQPLPYGATGYGNVLANYQYAIDFNDVQQAGDRDAHEPATGQTEIAFFWANDVASTYRPPGQLLQHTQQVAEQQPVAQTTGDPDDFHDDWSQQGIRVARLFAQAALGLADAGIAARDQKFLTNVDLWRPDTAIDLAATDSNPYTTADPDWEPLSQDAAGNSFSPCFPAWVSGHATFAASWAGIMQTHFGDNVTYTGRTDDPNTISPTRTFSSFSQAATENARSRVYLGVHFQADANAGLTTGYALAGHLTDNFLTYGDGGAPAFGLPSAPRNVNVTPDSESSVLVTWDPPSFPAGDDFSYRLIVRRASDNAQVTHPIYPSGRSQVIGAATSGPMYVDIYATNGTGEGPAARSPNFTVGAP